MYSFKLLLAIDRNWGKNLHKLESSFLIPDLSFLYSLLSIPAVNPLYIPVMALLAELIQNPYALQGLGIAFLAVLVSVFWQDLADEIPYSRIPLVGKNGLDIFNNKARARFTSNARGLIQEGFSKVRQHSSEIITRTRKDNRYRGGTFSKSSPP